MACDARCDKAWGINNRPKRRLSNNEDDYVWVGDDQLGTAPADPGTYEGDEPKPRTPEERLNKWCFRECERSVKAFYDPHGSMNDIDKLLTLRNLKDPEPNIPGSKPMLRLVDGT